MAEVPGFDSHHRNEFHKNRLEQGCRRHSPNRRIGPPRPNFYEILKKWKNFAKPKLFEFFQYKRTTKIDSIH